MQQAQHQGQKTAATRTAEVEIAEESPMRPGDFWRKRTVDEHAAEPGTAAPQRLDGMIAAAAELWNDRHGATGSPCRGGAL